MSHSLNALFSAQATFHSAEGVSSSPPLWRDVRGPKGPRSFNRYGGAGAKVTPDMGSDMDAGPPRSRAEDTTMTQFVSECLLPTRRGKFRLRAYRHEGNGRSLEPVVIMAVSADATINRVLLQTLESVSEWS